MDRRDFIRLTVGGIAAASAVRIFPFRVYSFPSEIMIARWYDDPKYFDIALVPATLTDHDRKILRELQLSTRGGFRGDPFGDHLEMITNVALG